MNQISFNRRRFGFIQIILLTVLFMLGCQSSKEKLITTYGAVADGKTNNSEIIQQLIDQVSESGGGRVTVPPGNFMTGTIFLKTGVELHLQQGACLLGPINYSEYAEVARCPLIYAKHQKNISVTGAGTIDGRGQELMLDVFKKLRSGELQEDSTWLVKRPRHRAMIMVIDSCSQVNVSDVTLKNSSGWVQDYHGCTDITINGITVQSTAYWNNDGLDITDCKDVKITNCFINAADDGICLKSVNPNARCENIWVDNCTVRSSANGFKLGTSSVGGFKNIKVRNLTVFDTYRSAITLQSVDGGILEDIDIQNVVAKNTGNAIFIRLGHRNKDNRRGELKQVYIANVKVEVPLYKPDQGYPLEGPPDHLRPGKDKMPKRPSHYHIYGHPFLPYNLVPSSIVGIPDYPVQNVTLENIEIIFGGGAKKEIAYWSLSQIGSIPENEAEYPEFSMFGELPSWGFYIRHVEGLTMKNITVTLINQDYRPAYVFDDVKGLNFSEIYVKKNNSGRQYIFRNVEDEKIGVNSEQIERIN